MNNNKLLWPALMVFGLLTQGAAAESMRCGTSLVSMEDSKAEVEMKCGAPAAIDAYCRNEYVPAKYGYDTICHNVDLWTYNFGPGTFLMKVEFEEGRLVRISHGDRVK